MTKAFVEQPRLHQVCQKYIVYIRAFNQMLEISPIKIYMLKDIFSYVNLKTDKDNDQKYEGVGAFINGTKDLI